MKLHSPVFARKIAIRFMLIGLADCLLIAFSLVNQLKILLIISAAVYILCGLVYIIISLLYWRCPHCGRRFPLDWHPFREAATNCCPCCGDPLEKDHTQHS